MAKLLDKGEFINRNVALMQGRLNSQYNTFLESKPTITKYFHINTKRSTTDKGTKDIDGLINSSSPIRYNFIDGFPIYNIEQIQLDLSDEEQGLDTSYEGEGTIIPNTIRPLQDDHFCIVYLDKHYLFRITHVSYDTIKSNNFYRINYSLKSVEERDYNNINNLVVERYHCIFDNIGTHDKCIIKDSDYDLLKKINEISTMMKTEYIDKFLDVKYNALMFMEAGDKILYDSELAHFCNETEIFYDKRSTDAVLFYEEKRNYFKADFENSIYDRIMHKDATDLNQVNCYYDHEPDLSTVSIFDYYRDKRCRYIQYYHDKTGPYGNELAKYIPKDLITAIDMRNIALITNPYEKFIYVYMCNDTMDLVKHIDEISTRRIHYDFHNFVFIPLVLYSLRQLSNEIVYDTTIIDEQILNENN